MTNGNSPTDGGGTHPESAAAPTYAPPQWAKPASNEAAPAFIQPAAVETATDTGAGADTSPGDSAVIETGQGSDGINRCPACGSTDVQLRASTAMLVCLFCRNEWSEASAEEAFGLGEGIEDLDGVVIASAAQQISDTNDVVTLACSACGAEVVIDTAHSMNARCHWCRHTLNLNQQRPNGAVPDAVLPFKLTHAQAVAKIREFSGKRKFFANRRFLKEFVPENVVGVYLPYLVVDARAAADYVGTGEVQTRRWTVKTGENSSTTYYAADVYRVSRSLAFNVDDLTLEAASDKTRVDNSVTNNIINAILPFDTKNAVKWNSSYLVGFTSEKRDMDVQDLQPTLEGQLLSIGRSQVEPTLKTFDRGVRWEAEKVDVGGSRWVSMYLPVWLYSYYQEDKRLLHYIAVNARTGETMGSVPVSHGRLLTAAITAGTVVEGFAIAALGLLA